MRFLLDYGWKHGLAEPAIARSKDHSVAVVGSGIGGLVTADALSRKGYAVTVFDSRQIPGGRMMNGLPGFRVDKDMVERRIGLLKQRGIKFQMGVAFGAEVKLNELREKFDAVFLAFGRADAVTLQVPGAELRGVFEAYPFVLQSAEADSEPKPPPVDVRGQRVVVLGGGDTAMDALRIAIRRGAQEAVCIYRRDLGSLPADAEEFANAQEEGAQFIFQSQPVAVIGNSAGAVTTVRCARTEPGEPDGSGRPEILPVAGTEFDVPADVVFVAYGYTAPKLPAGEDFGRLAVDERGQLVVDAKRMTSLPGVFAGGSIVRGGAVPIADVVRDAREAAVAIDRYLSPAI
jgi:glutamate synthase (NADPH/NADH) small chain